MFPHPQDRRVLGVFYLKEKIMAYIERYVWEDALIQAQKEGRICNGALLLALKLASAITWRPKKGREPGLYWKNQDALEAVGAGRSTYFKHRGELFDAGFFKVVKQNLIPVLPESTVETNPTLTESTVETVTTPEKSTVETPESTPWTPESTGDNPYSVDTYTVDTYSEGTASATAPAAGTEELREGPASPKDSVQESDSSKGSVEGSPQSTVETFSTLTLLDEGQTLRHCDSLGVEAVYNEDGNMNYGKTAERHGVAEAFRWEMARRLRAKMVARHMDVLALALKGAITIDTNNEEEGAAWL